MTTREHDTRATMPDASVPTDRPAERAATGGTGHQDRRRDAARRGRPAPRALRRGPFAELLQRAVDEAARLLEADGAMIYLLDADAGTLRFAFDAGIREVRSRRWVRRLELRLGQGMFGVAAAERRVVHTNDYLADGTFRHSAAADRFVNEVGLRSMVTAPMVAGDRVFGALGTFARRPGAFTDAQVGLVRALADHAAQAMANALLIEELDRARAGQARRADRERTLREIATAVSALHDPAEVIQRTVDESARLLEADGARIDLIDSRLGLLRWAYQSGADRPSDDIWPEDPDERLEHGVSGKAVVEGRVVISGDYLDDDQFIHRPGPDGYIASVGLRSVMAAPLIGDRGPFGALTIYSTQQDAWAAEDADLLEALATEAAIALRNARLIEELGRSRSALARRAEAEQALREIAGRITAIREPSELLQGVIDAAVRLVRADGGILDLLDPDRSVLEWSFDTGLRDLFSDAERGELWIPVGVGATGVAVAQDRTFIEGDDPRGQFPPSPVNDLFFDRTGFRSMIIAPISSETGPLGAIEVYARRARAFDESDAALIRSLADQAAIAIQNARLIDQLARSREETARRADAERTLREIAANISAIRNPDVILQQTVDEAKRLLDSTDARIDLLEDGRLRWAYTSELSDIRVLEAMDATFEIGEGLAGRVVAEGRPFRTGNYLVDERFPHTEASDAFVRAAGLHSALAVPLTGEAGVLGAISVATSRLDAYDDGDAELLTALADQAAIAIQNARLIEELQRSRTELAQRADTERSLREMAGRIAELRDPGELLHRIVDETRRLLGSDGAHLTRIRDEGDVLVPVVVAGSLDEPTETWLMGLEFPLMGGINGLAAGLGEPVWTADYYADARIPHDGDDDDVAERLGLRSMASVPLRSPEGGIIGTLAVSYREPHEFDEDELGLLKGLADHAAIALTNTSLYERLRASESRYRHLVQNSPDLVWSIDAEGRLSFVSDTCERLTGWKPEELLGQHFGALVHPSSRQVTEFDWTQGMTLPQQELRGRLNLLHRDGHAIPAEFTAMGNLDEDGHFVGANGSVRDIADRDRLERDLRRQAAEIASGEERAHLARELHDSVTQALFSMTLLARTIEMLIDRDPAKAREQLAALRELQREALAEMRALIFELRPGNVEQDGLYKALRTHTAALQGRIGLPIVLKSDLEDRLPVAIEEVLYRIAQEALHNVVKHAGAREVRLELGRDGAEVCLRIADDGKGFDPARVPDGHLGLTGMRTRADKIGAHLTVRSQPGSGTIIEVGVPPEAIAAAAQVAADLRRMEAVGSAE